LPANAKAASKREGEKKQPQGDEGLIFAALLGGDYYLTVI